MWRFRRINKAVFFALHYFKPLSDEHASLFNFRAKVMISEISNYAICHQNPNLSKLFFQNDTTTVIFHFLGLLGCDNILLVPLTV